MVHALYSATKTLYSTSIGKVAVAILCGAAAFPKHERGNTFYPALHTISCKLVVIMPRTSSVCFTYNDHTLSFLFAVARILTHLLQHVAMRGGFGVRGQTLILPH